MHENQRKMTHLEGGYITLKEAAKISGYAPDYVGQLIRKGKIPGKQIYSNVAWVTTEAAVREYIEKGGGSDNNKKSGALLEGLMRGEERPSRVFKAALYAVIALALVFLGMLLYALAVNFDRAIEKKSLQEVMERST